MSQSEQSKLFIRDRRRDVAIFNLMSLAQFIGVLVLLWKVRPLGPADYIALWVSLAVMFLLDFFCRNTRRVIDQVEQEQKCSP